MGLFSSKNQTAHWIQRTHLLRSDEYECSACGRRFDKPYAQCPNCGKNMKGSKYDPSWVDEAEIMDILGG